MSPLQLEVAGSHALGAMLGNVVLAQAAVLLGWAGSRFLSKCTQRYCPRLHAMDLHSIILFPSAPLVVFLFLYQGTSLAGMDLVLNPEDPGMVAAGVVAACVCVVVPLVVYHYVSSGVPKEAYVREDPLKQGCLMSCLLDGGEWVSRTRSAHFARRWGPVLRPFKSATAWYAVVEFAASFVISAVQAVNPSTSRGCGHAKVCVALVFLFLLVLEASTWPHLHGRNCVFDIVLLAGQTLAMVAFAAAYYSEDMNSVWFPVGAHLLIYCVAVLVLRTVAEVVAQVVIVAIGRRRRLQNAAFAVEEGDESAVLKKFVEEDTPSEREMPVVAITSAASTDTSPASPQGAASPRMPPPLLIVSEPAPAEASDDTGVPVLSYLAPSATVRTPSDAALTEDASTTSPASPQATTSLCLEPTPPPRVILPEHSVSLGVPGSPVAQPRGRGTTRLRNYSELGLVTALRYRQTPPPLHITPVLSAPTIGISDDSGSPVAQLHSRTSAHTRSFSEMVATPQGSCVQLSRSRSTVDGSAPTPRGRTRRTRLDRMQSMLTYPHAVPPSPPAGHVASSGSLTLEPPLPSPRSTPSSPSGRGGRLTWQLRRTSTTSPRGPGHLRRNSGFHCGAMSPLHLEPSCYYV